MKPDEGVIARRYARAAMMFLDDSGGYDAFAGGLEMFTSACRQVPLLETLLATPIVRQQRKQQLADEVARVLGIPDSVSRLVGILIANNRVGYLGPVFNCFSEMLDEKNGRVRGKVLTAVEMDVNSRQKIAAGLKSFFNKDVICAFHVDPSIHGGVYARVGNTVIDSSLKGKLAELRRRVMALSS